MPECDSGIIDGEGSKLTFGEGDEEKTDPNSIRGKRKKK